MSKQIAGRKVWALALATGLLGAAALAPAAHGKSVNITKPVGVGIPDRGAGATAIYGLLESTISVGKTGKAKKVRDVNVSIHAIGTSGTDPIDDLKFKLTGPTGASTVLWSTNSSPAGINNLTLGPWVADDESPLDVGSGNATDPTELFAPWVGTSQPQGIPLSIFDNGPSRGTWVLKALDTSNMQTSTLVSWRLNVVTGKPFLTKVPN